MPSWSAYDGDGSRDQFAPSSTASTSPKPRSEDHQLARSERGIGVAQGAIQPARLAVLAPALLGRAVPDRASRGRHASCRCPRTRCRLLPPDSTTTEPTDDGEPPLARAPRLGQDDRSRAPARRPCAKPTPCRNGRARAGTTCASSIRRTTRRSSIPKKRSYWMPVDLYVGGAEHAVLHLLYARFWHKVLFDLGVVSTKEPFQKLFNQGMILAFSYRDAQRQVLSSPRRSRPNGRQVRSPTAWTAEPADREDVEVALQRRQPRRRRRRIRRRRDAPLRNVHGPARCRPSPGRCPASAGVRRFLHRAWRLVADDDDALSRGSSMPSPRAARACCIGP